MDIDSVEALNELSAQLSERLGRPITVDKIANRFVIMKEIKQMKAVGEVIEQELLASELPLLDVFLNEVTKDIPTPAVVSIPRDSDRILGIDSSAYYDIGQRCDFYTTEDLDMDAKRHIKKKRGSTGPVPLLTLCSSKCSELEDAWKEMHQVLSKLTKVDCTIFVLDQIKEYVDEKMHVAQVWADGFVLEGKWKYLDGEFIQVEDRPRR